MKGKMKLGSTKFGIPKKQVFGVRYSSSVKWTPHTKPLHKYGKK